MLKHIAAGFSSLVVALIAVAAFAGPAPALTVGGNVPVEVRNTPRVSWVSSEMPHVSADRVRIEVLAPQPGGRSLWQFCGLEYVGPGSYRCGIDISRGTRARTLDGRWVAKVLVDGKLRGEKRFRI